MQESAPCKTPGTVDTSPIISAYYMQDACTKFKEGQGAKGGCWWRRAGVSKNSSLETQIKILNFKNIFTERPQCQLSTGCPTKHDSW